MCALYRHAGIRAVEIGSLMFGGDGHHPELELVRLTIPRRVYTQSHADYVVEIFEELKGLKDSLRGYRIKEEAAAMRHFTAKFELLSAVS